TRSAQVGSNAWLASLACQAAPSCSSAPRGSACNASSPSGSTIPSPRMDQEPPYLSTEKTWLSVSLEPLFLIWYTPIVLWALLAGVAWRLQVQQRDGWHG